MTSKSFREVMALKSATKKELKMKLFTLIKPYMKTLMTPLSNKTMATSLMVFQPFQGKVRATSANQSQWRN